MTTTEAAAAATGIALGIGGLAKTWRRFPDYMIPTLVAGIGAATVPALAGWEPHNVVAGIQAGLAATGLNQAFRQFSNRTGNTTVIPKP